MLFDAFWRAIAYCLHPKVVVLSLLPLLLIGALSLGLGYFFWNAAVAWLGAWLGSFAWVVAAGQWVDGWGMGGFTRLLPTLVLLLVVTPLVVLLCLLLVSLLMTPAMVKLVAQRRFARLERKRGGPFLVSVLWSLGSTVLALLLLVLSMPLWLIPPLVLLLPPLIWGWLTYRVFAFDVLADHASAPERKRLMKRHRSNFLIMGIVSGYLGAAPSLIWASGALSIALAPVLVPVAVWLYTLVFAFAALWFAHYALAALERMRAAAVVEVLDPEPLLPGAARAELPLLEQQPPYT